MSTEPDPALDPDVFAHAREQKLDAKHALAQALVGAGASEDDEAEVALVLDDAALDQLAERVIAKLAGDTTEPPAGFLDAVAGQAEDRRQAVVGAALGRRDDVADDGPLPTSGFDGGARPGLLRRPESHDDLIVGSCCVATRIAPRRSAPAED